MAHPATPTISDLTVQWINHVLEALWLLTVVLVPVIFVNPNNLLSEAVIAYVEVPKITLLHTTVAIMTILCLVKWGTRGGLHGPPPSPQKWAKTCIRWATLQPTRWVILAVWFFLATTIISTILSASFQVSLWGEVPGQDGLAAYHLLAYILLFAVVSTHLKTAAQMWRLIAAISVAGVLVAGYAVFQHYGYDFLGILEATGGGEERVTSTTGNAVFAAAVMVIPIVASLLLATVTLDRLNTVLNPWASVGRRTQIMAGLAACVMVLSVQLLGLVFTQSRGPWLGTILALVTFLALGGILGRWRLTGWAVLVLGLAVLLAWSVLQMSGIPLIVDSESWSRLLLTLMGISLLTVIFAGPRPLKLAAQRLRPVFSGGHLGINLSPRNASLIAAALGLMAVMVLVAVVVVPDSDSGVNVGETIRGTGEVVTSSNDGPVLDVQRRFTSISGEVLSGNFSKRGPIWRTSIKLMRTHPWFSFDELGLRWLRPFIGYGPDLFRYAFLLESPTDQDKSLLPLEPDHAHNFFLHQGIEQGLLGLLSSLGLFLSAFIVGGYQLARHRKSYSDIHIMVLVFLMAAMAGRFLEQLSGVARVSDLTVFWVLLALFTALPVVTGQLSRQEATTQSQTAARPLSRARGNPQPAPHAPSADLQRLIRLSLVAWLIGGLIALSWVKTINYARAGLIAGEAVSLFQKGEFQGSLHRLTRAIELAPDVSTYYTHRAAVYAAYLKTSQVPPESVCSLELTGVPYRECLVRNIHLSNVAATEQRPFYWRARLARADSALALGMYDEAIRLYREVVEMVPGGWPLHNRLAEAYIDIGRPESALEVLEGSLSMTGESSSLSEQALGLRILAQNNLKANGPAPSASEKN